MNREHKAISIPTSVQGIRSAATKPKRAEPGFEAMWATAGWLLPGQLLSLYLSGVGGWTTLAASFGILTGLAILSPLIAGAMSGLNEHRSGGDRAAWTAASLGAAVAWHAMGGWVVALPLTVLSLSVFLTYHKRYSRRVAQTAFGEGLPTELAESIAALPNALATSISSPLDRGLASLSSLGALRPELPEADALWADALVCLRRMVTRAETAHRLAELAQRSPEIERARERLEDELGTLANHLASVVDAASRMIAVGASTAGAELAERAEMLHALAEATEEVDDALRGR
ncbi:MAG: hypothetical protein AAGA54_08660 [Myxococcota bacterium]